ncbi:DUF3784 domain-containing protein [Allobacillus sp. SKP2-8]|uniref:DUF3784 domain-containing protein n=1 Tax=unclassified Allobacillus TaxID=2628859 RepID=UPI001183AE9E|nr:DUF3784 domain-containing protein [Allobacillus sp. SKP2-8]TSJ65760.1 DUF3784 domain-containing protein [Allobacillus sp. SKP2-8]
MIIMLLVIGLFLGLGFVFINGKGSFLIAGFNTMPSEEKEKYDVIALCKFMGKKMFALSFSMIFWLLSVAYDLKWLFYIGLVLFLAVIVFMLIYINTGGRFKK